MNLDQLYMSRALQLAASTPFTTHPNPMVGAVIVCDGKIIGEGCHRQCGQGHAEVNAIASVKDKSLLRRSVMYVTLEPCSHYGKTPPCAELIIRHGIPKVVVGAGDPFKKVAGRGIAMLRQAGIEVVEGILAEQSQQLNRRFFTAHTQSRPYITLKWAQSADRFMDIRRDPNQPAARISTPLTSALVHRERALNDAILTSASTVNLDNPQMDVRLWAGPSPQRIVIDRKGIVDPTAKIFNKASSPTLLYSSRAINNHNVENIAIAHDADLSSLLSDIYSRGTTSLLVEAGPRLLQAFIDSQLFDAIRIEQSPISFGNRGSHPAPTLPNIPLTATTQTLGPNAITVLTLKNSHPQALTPSL